MAADITGYSDSVQISSANGNINEVTTANGVTTLYTQKPDGTVVGNFGRSAPGCDARHADLRPPLADYSQSNGGPEVITGAVQITVLVTLTNQSLKPVVTYQTSLVHP